jgi:hypothetical protein
MTLRSYDPTRLDQVSLRLLDLCGQIRNLARTCQEHGLGELALHDRKAIQWIEHLELWAREAQARAELAALRQRGAQRAESLAQPQRAQRKKTSR